MCNYRILGAFGKLPEEMAQATFYLTKAKWLHFLATCKSRGTTGSAVLRQQLDSWLDAVEWDEKIKKESEKNEQ